MTDRKTIAFFPEPGAWGPTNNCVAIANVLAERGHRIVFVVDESFEGELVKRGFEERMMRMAPPEENADPTADPWAEFIRVTAPEFRKPTIEQISTVTKPIWEALVAGEQYSHGRIMEIWDDIRPDVVCTDNVTGYPAVELAGCPWVRFVSANPLEMRDPELPPVLSGLPIDDRSEWDAFRAEYHAQHEELLNEHNDFRASVGVDPCPLDEFNTNSPWANLYLFPEIADYPRSTAARRHVAPAELHRADERPAVRRRRAGPGRRQGGLPVARIARLHGRGTDAAADRRDGEDGAPHDRLDGPAEGSDDARPQHVRRSVPAAAVDPAAERPVDHARRQQHGVRGVPLRIADDRAPAVLGPVRQRTTTAGDRVRRTPRRPTTGRTTS